MNKHTNVFYIKQLAKIGGVETFIYEIARKYNWDVVLYYDRASQNQIDRIIRNIPCIPYIGQQIECERIFVNNDTTILSTTKFKDVVQMIHGMYKSLEIEPNLDSRITKRIAVSQAAADEYFELTGIMPEVFRNPITITDDEKSPVLYLISATRLSSEKGGGRMLQLAHQLIKEKVRFIWLIFTNDEVYDFPGYAVKLKPTLDIRPYIASIRGRGYGVQLSDSEGDPYFPKECMGLGVPVIVTPVPSIKEQGIIDGVNGYYVPFDMKDIDIDKIVNNIPSFEPYILEDEWNDLLIHKSTKYKEEMNMKFKVRALPTFKEYGLAPKELGKDNIPEPGYEFKVDKVRLDVLTGNNSYGVAFVELVEEIKETKEDTKPEETKTKKNSKKK